MDKVRCGSQTATGMRASSWITSLMAKVSTLTLTDRCTREIFPGTRPTVRGKRCGRTARFTKGISRMGKNTEKGAISGRKGANTMGNGVRTQSMGMDDTSGQMEG